MVFGQMQLSEQALEMVAARFRCLGEPVRLKILSRLKCAGPMTVGQLVKELQANQANVSKHLKVLTDAGILSRRAQGTAAYYSISDPMVIRLCDTVCAGVTEKLRLQAESFGMSVGKFPKSR